MMISMVFGVVLRFGVSSWVCFLVDVLCISPILDSPNRDVLGTNGLFHGSKAVNPLYLIWGVF